MIDHPLAAVIASISHDHAEFLGTDLAGIAGEKAGILKRGAPGVVAPQNEHARAMIEVDAKAAGAHLFRHGSEYMAHAERGRLVYQDDDGLLDLPLPRLAGAHQIENAGLAVATLRAARIKLPARAIEDGACDRGLAGAHAAPPLRAAGRACAGGLRHLARRRA